MTDLSTFTDLITRVRAADGQAAAELVWLYESFIRREVRFRMRDPRLRRLLDSMDICQSVLASFFVRAASGGYDLDRPEDLLKLLVAMTRNKLAFQARRQHQQRRDPRRVVDDPAALEAVAGTTPTPSRVAAGKELLAELRRRLSDDERRLADLRGQGHGWAAIAAEVGGTPQARRKQLARAVERVGQELGLDEVSHE